MASQVYTPYDETLSWLALSPYGLSCCLDVKHETPYDHVFFLSKTVQPLYDAMFGVHRLHVLEVK